MKKFLTALLACLCVFGATAQAHVLIADDRRQMGAVMHITPDDDPIAGEPSTITISIQDTNISEETHAFRLHISSDHGHGGDVQLQAGNGSVAASYVFPVQGVYTLTLSLEPTNGSGQTIVFRHAQRVSRGETAPAGLASAPLWARLGLVGSAGGLLAIGVVVFNKRKVLAAYARDRKV